MIVRGEFLLRQAVCNLGGSVKNKLDSLFFTRLFVSERKQIALMADEKLHSRTVLQFFLIASSRQVAQK